MINSKSRYRAVGTAFYNLPDGSSVSYLKRRFLPQPSTTPISACVVVTRGDRLDLIAARTLGDPQFFWHIADVNQAMNPFDLTDIMGRSLLVTPMTP